MSSTLESGWAKEELAVAEQMLLGQATVLKQVFPSITDHEMSQLFEACASWHDNEPIEVTDPACDLDEVAIRIVGDRAGDPVRGRHWRR